MVDVCRLKLLVFILISCILVTKFVNATPLQVNTAVVNQVANDQTKLAITNEQNGLIGEVEENKIISPETLKDDDDDDDDKKDDDKKDDKKDDKAE